MPDRAPTRTEVKAAPKSEEASARIVNSALGSKLPLSPFSPKTKEIRDIDLAWFRVTSLIRVSGLPQSTEAEL
jgi:hypothetical protein